MRYLLATGLMVALIGAGTTASAGVVPNHGGQNMSGAKIKPASQNQDSDEAKQPSSEKEEPAKDKEEKR